MGQRNRSTFTVTKQRMQDAQHARVILVTGCVGVTALALLVCAIVPMDVAARTAIIYAAASLGLLTGAVAPLLLWRACTRADRAVGPAGELLHLGADAVVVRGNIRVPWSAVSEVSVIGGATLRRHASSGVLGALARLSLRAAAPASAVSIGISDPAAVRGVHQSARHRRRVDVPLGAWAGTSELTTAAATFRRRLPAGVPVRTGNLAASGRRRG